MHGPFIGSEALAHGVVNRHQLRTKFSALFPGVYFSIEQEPTLFDRSYAAWLWSGRTGVLAGLAAAALHGSKWIGTDIPIDVVCQRQRGPDGVRVRRDVLFNNEVQVLRGLPLTTPARTAFDIARRGRVRSAVAHVDALLNANSVPVAEVSAIAADHPRTRGLRQLEAVLGLVDPGAQSPKESWLRLVIVEAGLPKPRTQIPVRSSDGWSTYYLDMGWEDLKIAVEYDGDHHRTNRLQYGRDIRRMEALSARGWIVIRVVAGDTPDDIVRRVRKAFQQRLSVR